ncbi:uncharacterized protein LOC114034302 [Vombatus ursinus]|uniref:uncharacterized protein LOC114034302 n=1 Tax=Vombatus ursinus TaxID=29139 RepID=UPI000FFD0D83|nr:uncharacterized protein LOC114034302 [Vombatus ursinus]
MVPDSDSSSLTETYIRSFSPHSLPLHIRSAAKHFSFCLHNLSCIHPLLSSDTANTLAQTLVTSHLHYYMLDYCCITVQTVRSYFISLDIGWRGIKSVTSAGWTLACSVKTWGLHLQGLFKQAEVLGLPALPPAPGLRYKRTLEHECTEARQRWLVHWMQRRQQRRRRRRQQQQQQHLSSGGHPGRVVLCLWSSAKKKPFPASPESRDCGRASGCSACSGRNVALSPLVHLQPPKQPGAACVTALRNGKLGRPQPLHSLQSS